MYSQYELSLASLAITLGSSSTQTFSCQYYPGAGLDFRNISSNSGILCDSKPRSSTVAGLAVTNLITSGQAGKASVNFQQRTRPCSEEPERGIGGDTFIRTCTNWPMKHTLKILAFSNTKWKGSDH